MDNNSIENTDLAKQYQDILDRYSKELGAATPVPTDTPTVSAPELKPEPTVPPTPVFETVAPPLPPQNSLFKYLFYISLLIFFGVSGTIIYTIFFTKISNQNSPTVVVPTEIPSPTPSTTEKFCEANDQKVLKGETFKAADGCNTCTCGSDLTITCTQLACEATPTVKLTPTSKLSASPTMAFLQPKKQTLPSDLVSVVKFNVKKDSTTAVTDSQIIIGDSILFGNFATVAYNIQNSGGAVYWLTKVSGSWQVVAGGQESPACTTLAKYNFPTSFACNK